LIEEQELEEVIHEESHQAHEVEKELPHGSVEGEDFDEANHVEEQVHEEGPLESTLHEDETLAWVPPFDEDEVIQASVPPSHEDKNE
jgi:hypothetical protein